MSHTAFKRIDDETIMPWGKHKGKEVQDVPAHYLFWLERENIEKKGRNDFMNSLLVYIEENRNVLESELRKK